MKGERGARAEVGAGTYAKQPGVMTMEYRQLGNTGETVSEIILGAWQFGHDSWTDVTDEASVAAMHAALWRVRVAHAVILLTGICFASPTPLEIRRIRNGNRLSAVLAS